MITLDFISRLRRIIPERFHPFFHSLSHIVYIFTYKQPRIKRLNYDQYWHYRTDGYGHQPYIEPHHRLITDILPQECSILDIGCGDGSFILNLLRHKNRIKAEGIDVSENAVRIAKSRGVNASVLDISSDADKLKCQFDFIVIAEVLEHIPNPEDVMSAIKDKYAKGVIITIPNIAWGFYRLRLLLGKFPMDWIYHPGEHIRFWSLPDIRWWLSDAFADDFSFTIVKVYPRGGLPFFNRLWPNLFARGFVLLIK